MCTQSTVYNLGDTANGSLAATDCKNGNGAFTDYYSFTATGQQNIRVDLKSPGMLTFLQLIDSIGAIVMNSAVLTNPDTVTSVRLKVSGGPYVLAVNSVNSGTTGSYRLVTTTDTTAMKGCGTVWITPGVNTTQTISNVDCTVGPGGPNYFYHVYTIVLLRAQEINLSEFSTALPPGMVLVGPSGTTQSSPDSAGTTALIQSTVTTQGAYQLWVGSANQSQFGKYVLTVR